MTYALGLQACTMAYDQAWRGTRCKRAAWIPPRIAWASYTPMCLYHHQYRCALATIGGRYEAKMRLVIADNMSDGDVSDLRDQ